MKNSLVTGFLLFIVFFGYGQTKYIESFDGVKIAYTDEGKGKPVLLLHGFLNSGDSWNRTALKKMLLEKGYRVIAPDLRGTGRSDKPQEESGYQNGAEVKDLVLLLNMLQIKKCKAIGYSRGSIVLAKLLTQEKRIKKAVIGGMGIDFTIRDWDKRIMFSQAFNGKVTKETEGAVAYAESINADFRSLHLQQKYQPCASKEELKNIKAKVLLISGDQDTGNGNRLDLKNAIPGSKLKLVKGDHNKTIKTKEFAETVLMFL